MPRKSRTAEIDADKNKKNVGRDASEWDSGDNDDFDEDFLDEEVQTKDDWDDNDYDNDDNIDQQIWEKGM